MNIQKELFTVEEVATILGFSVSTIRNWITAGKIKPTKLDRNVRVSKKEIERLLNGGENE